MLSKTEEHMETNKLFQKEEEIRSILNLYIFKLQCATTIIKKCHADNEPCEERIYKEIKEISIDFLAFLDFVDELATTTTATRCSIQNWLEVSEERKNDEIYHPKRIRKIRD